MINVFYRLNPRVRQRLRETYDHAPHGVTYRSLVSSFEPDHQLSFLERLSYPIRVMLSVLKFLQIPNIRLERHLPRGTDLIQTPGQLLLNRHPYIIDIDTVACLALYSLRTLNGIIGHFLIKQFLTSHYCKGLFTISYAARQSVLHTFQSSIVEKKIHVIYPYVQLNPYSKKSSPRLKLLFISTNFYLKGGKEILLAFEHLHRRFSNLELIMVTRTPIEMQKKYKSWKNIFFVDASLSKEILYKQYYSQADIFVVPTYQDSFGLVFLEAAAAGLPIIATRMFAIPEVVHENKNGFLLEPPFSYYHKDFTPNPLYWEKNLTKLAKETHLPFIVNGLVEKLALLIEKPDLRLSMGKYSRELVEHGIFSESVRQQRLLGAYSTALQT